MNSTFRFFDEYFELALCAIILTVIIALITIETALRAAGLSTLSWSLDVNLGLLVWITWLSTGAAIRHRSHLRFTLLRSKFSNQTKYALYIVEWAAWLVTFGILLMYSYDVLLNRMASGAIIPGTSMPRYILYISVPVGSMIILLRVFQQMYLISTAYIQGKSVEISSTIGTND